MKQKKKWLLLGFICCIAVLIGYSSASAATRDLFLAATDGYVYMPDGVKVYIRGFVADTAAQPAPATLKGRSTLPAPIIDVDQGDDVFIHVRNVGNINVRTPPDPHTIHLHGIHATTQNDGFPENSWVIPIGGSGTYYFYAANPGSYMYHCHVEASEHVQLGMYGAMIIRPTTNRTTSVYGGSYGDTFDVEYVQLISDVDTAWHRSVQIGATLAQFNGVNFKPSYWLLNGRAFPDTIRPVNAVIPPATGAPLASGPPDGALVGSNNLVTYAGLEVVPNFSSAGTAPGTGRKVLVRLISLAFQTNPQHFHGWHVNVVGKDAMPIPTVAQHPEYTITVGSGETYDLIIDATQRGAIGQYATQSNNGTNTGNLPFTNLPQLFSAFNPAVFAQLQAIAGAIPVIPPNNNTTTQWFPVHNHDDYKATNNGAYLGGGATLIVTVP